MDSDGFVEKCLFCGGRVKVRKTKTKCYFFSFKSPEVKKCSHCQRILKAEDIVLSRPGEILGWVPI